MNNLNLHQLLNSAEVYVNSILESLNSDTLPAEDCVSELKNILLRYIEESEHAEKLYCKYSFTDFSEDNKVNASIISSELSSFPDAINMLFDFGLKKLAGFDNSETFRWLRDCGLIAPVEIHLPDKNEVLYTITSEGYIYFDKKKILSQTVQKEVAASTLPEGLRISPKAWNDASIYQAYALKHFYDSKNISDYMIFPSPTSENLLIGCEISKDAEPCLVFVWTEEPLNRDLKEYIGKISETEEIPHIAIVYTDKSEEKDIDNYITAERHGEKVKKYFTEV